MIRFYFSLWAAKLLFWLYTKFGERQNDRPGMLAMRLCPQFLSYIKKPKLLLLITGTNGKSSLSSLTAQILEKQGYSVAYNDWGANHHAGIARLLLAAVNLFNHSVKDAAVVEIDELICQEDIAALKPDYFLINNIARDSLSRNAHPEYVAEQLAKAIAAYPKAALILNADDPLSFDLAKGRKKTYFAVNDLHLDTPYLKANDFRICPQCAHEVIYHYRNYRHIGNFYCPYCGYHSPKGDYTVSAVNQDSLIVQEKDGNYSYPLLVPAVHQIYNEIALIALLREVGISAHDLAKDLKTVHLPRSREMQLRVGPVEIVTELAKGQNPTAISSVFAAVAQDKKRKEVVLLLDEEYADKTKTEESTWIYSSDYAYLNDERIVKIVIGGDRCLDHRLCLLLAGVREEKIAYNLKPTAVIQDITLTGVEIIYILHDLYARKTAEKLARDLEKRLQAEKGEKDDH